jgi:pyruvate dehydrogenase E2 component (dihydrolipoamide acetyltransferase)
VLSEIKVNEGETVAVNTVVAVINGGAAQPAQATEAPAQAAPPAEQPAAEAAPTGTQPTDQVTKEALAPDSPPAESVEQSSTAQSAAPQATSAPTEAAGEKAAADSIEDLRRTRSSPLVRKIAQEHGIDISQIEGTGISGRVTKNDILSFIENRSVAEKAPAEKTPAQQAPATKAAQPSAAGVATPARAPQTHRAPADTEAGPPPFAEGDRYEIEPMSIMRRRIAERMVESRRISAHVTSFMEVDFTETARLRDELKGEYLKRDGVKLTFLPFTIKAVIEGIKKWPIINSAVWGDQVVYKKDINIGVAVALDWGLIVPVIRNADEKSLLGLARAVNDLGERARLKHLKPDEVAGGTFTITNPGVFGGLTGTPIINQPQVAILGVGVIKKRPVVIDDAIAIRQIGILGLSFDHRVIDGAVADQFMAVVRDVIEEADYTS